MSKKCLLIATSNEGKLREWRAILTDVPFELVGLPGFPEVEPVPETGATFIENASLKATGYARQTKVLTLADDSGLLIEALGGAPGVLSARYFGEATSYAARNLTLLAPMKGVTDRSAHFVCAVAIADSGGRLLHVLERECEGNIAASPRGAGGFGYDPIFIPAGQCQTFAELPSELKNLISHRALAAAAARDFLSSLTGVQTPR